MFRAGDISSARPRRRRRTPLAPLLSIPLSSRRIHAPRLCLQPCTRAAAELYLTTARDGRDLDEHGVGRLLNAAKDGAPSPPWELTLLHHPLLLDLEHQFPPPLSTSSAARGGAAAPTGSIEAAVLQHARPAAALRKAHASKVCGPGDVQLPHAPVQPPSEAIITSSA